MKESKFIIISLYIFCIIITIVFGLLGAFNNLHGIAFNILCNLYSGIIIGLITGYCSYFNEKRRIVNNVFNYYYTLYTTCYTAISAKTLGHINIKLVNKKFNILMPKITENLENYNSFSIRKKDKYLRIMDPNIDLENFDISKGEIINLTKIFNSKHAEKYLKQSLNMIEKILICINRKKFENDFKFYKNINDNIFIRKDDKKL